MFQDEYFAEELRRIQFDFEDSLLEVDCLKDLEFEKLEGKKISFRKGMKVKLPFWLARILEKEGYVKVHVTEKIDYPTLYKKTLGELEHMGLQNINKYFYILARMTLEDAEKKKLSLTFRDKQKMEIEIRKLMTSRLSKILKIAEKEKNITNMVRNMTPEEQWLYQLVSDAVKSWKTIWKTKEDQ